MSFQQQRPFYSRNSNAPAQRDAMRAMLVAAAFDDSPRLAGAKSPDSTDWSSGGRADAFVEDIINSKSSEIEQQSGSRKRSAAPLAEPLAKHRRCSPCDPNVDAETSPGTGSFPGVSLSPSSSDFTSPRTYEVSPVVHSCPAWEGLGKGFLDLALGLVAPLDASCPRVVRTPSPSLSDQERMENAVKMFNRELDERLGSLLH